MTQAHGPMRSTTSLPLLAKDNHDYKGFSKRHALSLGPARTRNTLNVPRQLEVSLRLDTNM